MNNHTKKFKTWISWVHAVWVLLLPAQTSLLQESQGLVELCSSTRWNAVPTAEGLLRVVIVTVSDCYWFVLYKICLPFLLESLPWACIFPHRNSSSSKAFPSFILFYDPSWGAVYVRKQVWSARCVLTVYLRCVNLSWNVLMKHAWDITVTSSKEMGVAYCECQSILLFICCQYLMQTQHMLLRNHLCTCISYL